MGMVQMEKISLVGLADEKTQIIAALSKLGAVSVEQDEQAEALLAELSAGMVEEGVLPQRFDPQSRNIYFPEQQDVHWTGEIFESALEELTGGQQQTRLLARLTAVEYRKIQQEAQRRLNRLQEGIAVAQTLSTEKKPMFTLRRAVKASAFEQQGQRQGELMQQLEKLLENRQNLQRLWARRAALSAQVHQILPWESISLRGLNGDAPLRYLSAFTGSVQNKNERLTHLSEAVSAATEGNYALQKLASEGEHTACLLLVRNEDAAAAERLLRSFEFAPLPKLPTELGEDYGRALQQWRDELKQLDKKEAQLQDEAQKLSGLQKDFELLYDFYLNANEKLAAMQRLLNTGRLFVLQGYVPAKMSAALKTALEKDFALAIDVQAIPEGEPYPIALSNRGLVRPYEAIIEMFSLPQSGSDVDPTPVMAPFYAFFFGIMLSDFGYGLALAGLCAFLLYKVKVEGNMRRMCLVFFQGGLAAMVFGLLFGSFFGDLLSTVSSNRLNFPRLWFDPVQEPIKLMVASIVFGAVHLFVGLGVKFYMLCRSRDYFGALVEVVPWYLIIIGAALAGLNYGAGQYLALAGSLLIVLFSARGCRNPIKRVFSGLGTLYGVTGYLGDLLSYTRILALTLATSVIAMVVNILGSLMGFSVMGIVFCVVVMLFGHTLNLALSGLSAYVHATRLQYVEFFGKFYEGGGERFMPLAMKTRYTRVEADEL